jgi:predicted component of type VI protein secretion system
MKNFPGAPPLLNKALSDSLIKAAGLINPDKTKKGEQVEVILVTLSECLLNPSAYFDLYSTLCPKMKKQFEWWNKNIFYKEGRTQGDPTLLMKDSREFEEIGKIDDLGAEGWNLFVFSIEAIRKVHQKHNGNHLTEALQILDSILWCIYIGICTTEFFDDE